MVPCTRMPPPHDSGEPLPWSHSLMEAAELGLFMLSACVFTVLLYHPHSPALAWIPNPTLRRLLMGIAMGLTAVGIIQCPWGRASGAHFNPAITLTFLRLGKIGPRDAAFYILFQFLGGIAGVGLSWLLLGAPLASPQVNFAVTIPGPLGPAAAFAAEAFMAALLMAVVLITSNRPALAPYTTYCMGCLIASYILLFAPISGFSINPARTFASAVFAHLWTSIWIYFTAPLLGMFFSAELYLRLAGKQHYFHHRHLTQR